MGNANRGQARIFSLLKMFGLEDRFINLDSMIEKLLTTSIDYNTIVPKIEHYRQISYNFLKQHLSSNE